MGRLFGTDGVRGVAGEELTAELAGNLGRAAVGVLGRHGEGTPTFVVGRDPRDSGEWLEDALVEGIRSAGGDVILAGIEPTPAIAYLTTDLGAASGVVISASHNPPEYNGIKFFGGNGMKLADELEDEIESALADPPGGDQPVGHILAAGDSRDRYVEHILAAAEAPLDGMTVVVDCANGAASLLAPEILRRLGATVHAINVEPNGTNINLACGALYPEVVAAEVVRLGADAGVCLDGDADRALFSDARGSFIDGDQVLASCAVAMKASGALTHNTVVSTVMANLGFYLAMREAGIEVIAAKVGDRYVLEEMLRVGAVVGGEQSGHVIFREHATTGDGLLTAVRFLTLAARDQRSVEDVASVMRRFPQAMINVPVADREAVATNGRISEAVRSAEDALGSTGRVLVRPSGTEPLIRVMVEAESDEVAGVHAQTIAEVVTAELGS
ncbi:MAG: phosphoglucosamine mutase [Actinomycetota bacterium]|jgi:phosphoglucosamine mutase|nr:phosphoglucosamine mutase [Actinomycetota bacterium]